MIFTLCNVNLYLVQYMLSYSPHQNTTCPTLTAPQYITNGLGWVGWVVVGWVDEINYLLSPFWAGRVLCSVIEVGWVGVRVGLLSFGWVDQINCFYCLELRSLN